MVGLDDIKRIMEYPAILILDTKIKLMDFNLNNLVVSKSRIFLKIKKIQCKNKAKLLNLLSKRLRFHHKRK